MMRRWCTLEAGFLSYYESERNPTPISRVDVTEVVSLAVNNTQTMTGAGYEHTQTHIYTPVHFKFKVLHPHTRHVSR